MEPTKEPSGLLPDQTPETLGPAADPAQQSLVSALRSSFAVLRLIMIVLLVLYLSSGVFRIQPGEQGVIVRLGKLVDNADTGRPVFEHGWIWWALPAPIDEKIRLSGSIQKLKIDTFLFKRQDADITSKTDIASIRPTSNTLKPGQDGAMLTGDMNLSHGLWEVEFRLSDAAQFVKSVSEEAGGIEPILRRLFETAILREVAHYKVEEVTRTRIDILADRVARRLQNELKDLDLGVEVVKVNPNSIVPPQVAPAFEEVTRAENERKQQEDAAQKRATEILNQVAGPQHRELLEKISQYGAAELAGADPARLQQLRDQIGEALKTAQGEVATRLKEAEAERDTAQQKINREYQEFTFWLQQYRQHPKATLISLWASMRSDVLDNRDNEIFWVPTSEVIDIVVNRDPDRAIEAEKQRYQKQMEPPH
jgi:modulator of FtsH protease HflK